jgi:hypothetical protein
VDLSEQICVPPSDSQRHTVEGRSESICDASSHRDSIPSGLHAASVVGTAAPSVPTSQVKDHHPACDFTRVNCVSAGSAFDPGRQPPGLSYVCAPPGDMGGRVAFERGAMRRLKASMGALSGKPILQTGRIQSMDARQRGDDTRPARPAIDPNAVSQRLTRARPERHVSRDRAR